MLVDFTVENFLSIRDRQTLSFVRPGNGSASRLAIDEPLAGGDLSPVAAIFGPNGSGKTNVIEAMRYTRRLIAQSARRAPNEPLPMAPFLLDDVSSSRPFFAEFHFVVAEREFRYSLSLRDGQVETECLKETIQRSSKRATSTLFSRFIKDNETIIKTSSILTGNKAAVIGRTRRNCLFLSQAAQDNYQPLIDVYNWLVGEMATGYGLIELTGSQQRGEVATTNLLVHDAGFHDWLTRLLVGADLGIMEVSVRSQRIGTDATPVAAVDSIKTDGRLSTESVVIDDRDPIDSDREPVLMHRRAGGDRAAHPVPWSLESTGTKQLWTLAADIYRALGDGARLLVDEFEGLHPAIVREIVRLFQTASTNPYGAQLIFTSHDTNLLGNWAGQGYMLDRDQIWFTEKDYFSGATSLYSLSDFKVRKDLDTESAYIRGAFGAVPMLTDLVEMGK
ncbi:MAG: ATP-binding protein [Propionibacteriaceae bacterium]|jgi:AAA15 family ATPase/GTPase|nr:ATP-binding protein [Propionibacteriaceae bacterium]